MKEKTILMICYLAIIAAIIIFGMSCTPNYYQKCTRGYGGYGAAHIKGTEKSVR